MVRIEDLMEYGSKRKVTAIAKELGYSGPDYPDEVLAEVKRRLGADPGPSVSATAHSAAESEQADEAQADLKSVQSAAENRAAGLLVALDTLTMMHCASRKFTDPNLQQAVDESQNRLKQMLSGVANYYEPTTFLAPTPLAQLATGGNGSTPSLNGNGKPSSATELIDLEVES